MSVFIKRKLIQRLYQPGSRSLLQHWRADRMRCLIELTGLKAGAKVLDLGGRPYIWDAVDLALDVTIVNIKPVPSMVRGEKSFRSIQGNACDMSKLLRDRSFDFVFSNATIEHVGGAERRRAFANEVHRLATAFWVQTPSPRFPVECHTGMPFYWHWPEFAKDWLSRLRRRSAPDWDDEIRGTTVVSDAELRDLFPGGMLYRERRLGFEKSYAVYRRVVEPSAVVRRVDRAVGQRV